MGVTCFSFIPSTTMWREVLPVSLMSLTGRLVHSATSISRRLQRMRLSSARRLALLPVSLTLGFYGTSQPAVAFTAPRFTRNFSSTKTPAGMDSTATGSEAVILKDTQASLENSWVRQLSPETEENLNRSRRYESLADTDDNRTKRPVFNGRYVLVKPTGLREPRIVLYSKDLVEQLELTPEQIESDEFVDKVSGNRVLGDGRAISIGELHGLELQLKGAGRTPFHRGADGRAVLRSSIREFLASEAMHYLGVPTTRALSLVVSEVDTTQRPWYSDDALLRIPSMDDPRFQKYPENQRKQILQQMRQQKADPNVLVTEKLAITTRVASSFMRVGHIDLFARRAEAKSMETADETNSRWNTKTLEWKELEDIIWHACYREFREEAYDPFIEEKDIAGAATVLLEKAAEKLAYMVANWVRVGFAQGNFNGDNCLVGGKTMDYGPFGWLEEYDPLFAKWTGSGQHFGFLNQPSAGFSNYNVLVESVVPVICAAKNIEDPDSVLADFMQPAADTFQAAADSVFRVKLGFEEDQDVGDDVWTALEPIMRSSRTDWTLFFRQLTYVMKEFPDMDSDGYEGMLTLLEGDDSERDGSSPFYEKLSSQARQNWLIWIEQWRTALASSGSADTAFERMRTANPKYVLREWMLVHAYTSAANGEEAALFDLYDLVQRPYDEGSSRDEKRYYRRAPEAALMTGGTAFMS